MPRLLQRFPKLWFESPLLLTYWKQFSLVSREMARPHLKSHTPTAMICCMVIPPLYRVGRLLALAIGLSNFELSGLCDSRKRPLVESIEF